MIITNPSGSWNISSTTAVKSTAELFPTGSSISIAGNYVSSGSIAYFNGKDTPVISILRPTYHYSLRVKKLSSKARLPERAHSTDLGYDLFSSEPITIHPGAQVKIPTGIACNFPAGYGALIRDRSSIASKQECLITGGVIDQGYTGEILVLMRNLSRKRVNFATGDKIAQMILMPVVSTEVVEVDELDMTDRGEKGFGSSDYINNQNK